MSTTGAHADSRPRRARTRYRFLCETWVKYNYRTPLADELYRLEQRESRRLKGKGADRRDG